MIRDKDSSESHGSRGPAKIATTTLRDSYPEFPGRFKQLVVEKEINLSRLRDATKLSRPTLARIASGDANPLLDSLLKTAKCFGVSLSEMLGPQAGINRRRQNETSQDPFQAQQPQGDRRAKIIYDAACKAPPFEDLCDEVDYLQFQQPGESYERSIMRAILDVFHHQTAWIDHKKLERNSELETQLFKKYRLPVRNELADADDAIPMRVIDTPSDLLHILQLHAVTAMAAGVVKELMRTYRVLGFSDGFAVSTLQRFLRRGDLVKTELVPLTWVPHFIQFELSCSALIGSLTRSHYGYGVRSNIEVDELQSRLGEVEVAFVSCGTAERESLSRVKRLIEGSGRDYDAFLKSLEKKKVVGDLMYHFLDTEGNAVQTKASGSKLDNVNFSKPLPTGPKSPLIYSASLDCLAGIAKRGCCILLAHSESRAKLAHAALKCAKKPINFLVTTRQAAEKMLQMK